MSTSSPALPPTLSNGSPIANGFALRSDPLQFLRRLVREAGNFAHYELSNGIFYLANDPAIVREILLTQEPNFRKWSFNDSFRAIFRTGLIGSEGELHQRMQRIARPAFHQNELARHAKTIVDLTRERIEGWHEGEIDLRRELNFLTLEIVGRLLFSRSLGDYADEILEGEDTLQRLSIAFGTSQRTDEIFARTSERLTEIAREIFNERAARGGDEDLLGHLLAAHQKKSASAEAAIEEVHTFILAGYITTASTLAAACWLLAQHPHMQKKLHEEVDRALGTGSPELGDLARLPYCEMILLEALRMYPPVWVLGRKAETPVRLGEYFLPAGSKIVICAWLLHHSERSFPEPEKFRPERWENDLRNRLPRGSFIPFSVGSRSCMGERLAMMEAMLILASIAQRWKFSELADKPDPGWTPQIIYWPQRGIRLAANLR